LSANNSIETMYKYSNWLQISILQL